MSINLIILDGDWLLVLLSRPLIGPQLSLDCDTVAVPVKAVTLELAAFFRLKGAVLALAAAAAVLPVKLAFGRKTLTEDRPGES